MTRVRVDGRHDRFFSRALLIADALYAHAQHGAGVKSTTARNDDAALLGGHGLPPRVALELARRGEVGARARLAAAEAAAVLREELLARGELGGLLLLQLLDVLLLVVQYRRPVLRVRAVLD